MFAPPFIGFGKITGLDAFRRLEASPIGNFHTYNEGWWGCPILSAPLAG